MLQRFGSIDVVPESVSDKIGLAALSPPASLASLMDQLQRDGEIYVRIPASRCNESSDENFCYMVASIRMVVEVCSNTSGL